VQYVIRLDADFRGFAGTIASGRLRAGDEVVARPSGRRSRVKSLVTYDSERTEAFAPMAVTVTLQDEIDVSRGDRRVTAADRPQGLRGVFHGDQRGAAGGTSVPSFRCCRVTTFMAVAIIEATSATLAGPIIVVSVALASSPNFVMYCSATRSCTAS